jgi:hypothetical protein
LKLLWWDGDGLCLFAKRLERGGLIWPRAEQGAAVLTPAQLSMLLEGIDWRTGSYRPAGTGRMRLRQSESDVALATPTILGRDSMGGCSADQLPDDPDALRRIIAAMVQHAVAAEALIAKLRFQLARYRRAEFGRFRRAEAGALRPIAGIRPLRSAASWCARSRPTGPSRSTATPIRCRGG